MKMEKREKKESMRNFSLYVPPQEEEKNKNRDYSLFIPEEQ